LAAASSRAGLVDLTASMPAEAAERVSIRGVSKRFRSGRKGWRRADRVVTAVDNVSLSVEPGRIVSLLGPSGCGKTTLLRMVAGLIEPDEGAILVDGAPVEGPKSDRALVFQNFGLLPWRTVLDNVAFPLELDGMPRARRYEVAREYIELVGLQRFEHEHPDKLSGGMQQRVGIARALTRKPILLLMDEPFGALDAQTREELQDEVLRILDKTRNTVLFVTHSITEALVMSHKVVVFSASPGRIKSMIDVPDDWRSREHTDLRTSAAFKEQEHTIRELLRRPAGPATGARR
jgi:NitT/TauT family transport system ATP-binding protein